MTYNDWEGNSVSYPGGYPDFKAAGLVIQEVDIGAFKGSFINRGSDVRTAARLGYVRSYDSVWHHHQDQRTLQEVDSDIHQRFIHRGGIAKMKNARKPRRK